MDNRQLKKKLASKNYNGTKFWPDFFANCSSFCARVVQFCAKLIKRASKMSIDEFRA